MKKPELEEDTMFDEPVVDEVLRSFIMNRREGARESNRTPSENTQ